MTANPPQTIQGATTGGSLQNVVQGLHFRQGKFKYFRKSKKYRRGRTPENQGTPSPSVALDCKCAFGAKMTVLHGCVIFRHPQTNIRRSQRYMPQLQPLWKIRHVFVLLMMRIADSWLRCTTTEDMCLDEECYTKVYLQRQS